MAKPHAFDRNAIVMEHGMEHVPHALTTYVTVAVSMQNQSIDLLILDKSKRAPA